jgi:hypothetical protein
VIFRYVFDRMNLDYDIDFHISTKDSEDKAKIETTKAKLIHGLFTELIFMRVPTNVEISLDGTDALTSGGLSFPYLETQL